MFSRFIKIIGALAIFIVIIGHHSLQVLAMNHVIQHDSSSECNIHTLSCNEIPHGIDICSQIQSDKIQISTQYFVFSHNTTTSIQKIDSPKHIFCYFSDRYERVEISYAQLPRSHL